MKKTNSLVLLAAALAVVSTARVSSAALIYSTGFNTTDTPAYAAGALAGQNGWSAHSGAGTNALAVSLSGTNGSVAMTTNGEDDNHQFSQLTGGSYYLSADITVSAAQATGDYFMHLGDGSATVFNARTYVKSSGAGFVMALGTGAGTPTYGTTVLNFGTTYHVLAEYDMNAGTGNDTGNLFINPTVDPVFGVGDTPYVAATTIGTDATVMGGVYLRQGAVGSAATLVVDNIAVNALNAVPVPEPASIVLGGLGLIGLIGVARRRKAA